MVQHSSIRTGQARRRRSPHGDRAHQGRQRRAPGAGRQRQGGRGQSEGGRLEQQHEDTEQDTEDLAAGKGKEAADIDQALPEPVSAKPSRGRNNNIFPARRSRHHPSSSAPSTSPGVQPGPAASVGSESGAATPLGPESPNGTQYRTQKTLVCLRSHAAVYTRAHTHNAFLHIT